MGMTTRPGCWGSARRPCVMAEVLWPSPSIAPGDCPTKSAENIFGAVGAGPSGHEALERLRGCLVLAVEAFLESRIEFGVGGSFGVLKLCIRESPKPLAWEELSLPHGRLDLG